VYAAGPQVDGRRSGYLAVRGCGFPDRLVLDPSPCPIAKQPLGVGYVPLAGWGANTGWRSEQADPLVAAILAGPCRQAYRRPVGHAECVSQLPVGLLARHRQ
jgi:hypothetical protein